MNFKGWLPEEEKPCMPHQRIHVRPVQAAKLSEHGGVSMSSQPPELEGGWSSRAKTASMLVSQDDVVPRGQRRPRLGMLLLVALVPGLPALALVLVLALVETMNMFSLWQPLMALIILMLVIVILQFYHRVLQQAVRMHRRGGRLAKWGPQEWVLDSGAGFHRTSNQLVLEAPDVLGLGSVRTDRFELPGVRYVFVYDDLERKNVVSVSQLARDHGLVTVFEPTSCHVKEKKTGQIVGKGRLRNGMYMLDYLRVVGQYIGDGGGASSGGKRGDGGGGRGHGGPGNNGEGRGGGGRRDVRGEETGASRNQEQGGRGSGAAGGDINDEEIVNQEQGSSENEIQAEMNDDNVGEDDSGKIHQETNGNGEDDEDKQRGGGSAFGESCNNKTRTGLFGLSQFAFILLLLCTTRGAGDGEDFNNLAFNILLGFSFLFILGLLSLRTWSTMQSTSWNWKLVKQIVSLFRGRSRDREDRQEGTSEDYVQESSQEHNRRLFGLSRFDVTMDPTGYRRRQLPAGAFPSSTNVARREEFLVDSGASFHATWNESILVSYPKELKDHTEPPTRSFGGIIGFIAVTRSGYLSGAKIKLDGVLLAPKSRMNLVSVGQLSVQYKVQVEMDDEGVVIKKKQDGVQIGGGKLVDYNLYVLEYFNPGGLLALSPTPDDFKIFGTRPPGRPHVNTVPSPAGSTTEETGAGREPRAVRTRKPNTFVTGPMWS